MVCYLKFRKFLMLFLIMLLLSAVPVSAKEAAQSYTYDDNGEVILTPDAAKFSYNIDDEMLKTTVSGISDVVIAKGEIYLVDSGNNRILITGLNGNFIRSVDSYSADGIIHTFKNPSGLFVTGNGEIYVADTENKQIVHLKNDGTFIRRIQVEPMALLGKNFIFYPTKVAVDSVGRIFAVSRNFNQGLLELNCDGEFVQCLGAPAVSVNPAEYFWRLISTKDQLSRLEEYVPTEFNSVAVDEEDFLFVTSSAYSYWDYIGKNAVSLRKLNALGVDVLKSYNGMKPFGDEKLSTQGAYRGGSTLVDVIPLDYGGFAVLDSNRSKVFVYNSSSQLLFEFGAPGTVDGAMLTPTAVAFCNDRFYVADSGKNCISVFALTEYGKNLMLTAKLHEEGNYNEEDAVWEKLLSQNCYNMNAISGRAMAAFRSDDMKTAMKYFRQVNNKAYYSKAYQRYRKEWLNRNFAVMIFAIVGVSAAIYFLNRFLKRKLPPVKEKSLLGSIKFSKRLIFHPLAGSWELTREQNGTIAGGCIILTCATLALAFQSYCTGFIFRGSSVAQISPFVVLIKLLGPILLYSLCNWCVSSLMDGEATFKQIFMANCYAVTPLILLVPPAVALSNIMVAEEGAFFRTIIILAYFWAALLFICANKQIHDYSMGKSLAVLFISLLVMAVLVFLTLLFLILMQQFGGFCIDFAGDLFDKFF